MPTERLSLAEQIAQLEEAAPVDCDPEDYHAREGADGMLLDNTSLREHYFEVGPSNLRNRLPSVADAKYEGVRTSRKQMLEDPEDDFSGDDDDAGEEEDDDDEDMDSQSDDEDNQHKEGHGASSIGRTPSASEESANGSADEEEAESMPVLHPARDVDAENPSEDVTSTLKKTREDDMKKARAVKRQIGLWDTLLDIRIRLQKSVVSANKLPPPSEMSGHLEISSCQDALSKFLHEASSLTEELAQLQESLLSTNGIIKPPARKRRKLDADTPINEYHNAFVVATEDVANIEQVFHPYLLKTLSKWSAKIQAVAPSVLLPSNRGTFLKGGQNLKSVVQLINETFDDREKLLARTQATRAKKPRIGAPPTEQVDGAEVIDADVFDDTDFYQKMLRDIIDARGNGNANEGWMLLQKQKKAKKKVDTKASKGRKLRYEAHEKLQNFMVPVPVAGAWHEEQIDELFASLLGKGFENIVLNAEAPQVRRDIEIGGFRVFG